MSSSPIFRDLFAAAREDAPSDEVRAAVWDRVATTVTMPAGAMAVAKSVTTATGAKLLAVGAVVGAATVATLGLVLSTVANDGPSGGIAAGRHSPSAPAHVVGVGARLADPETPRARAIRQEPAISSSDEAARPGATRAPSGSVDDAHEGSSLSDEARVVTEARAALLHGDPARALTLAQSTRHRESRSLEPEELGLEVRALRALGRTDEAMATELTLRRRFPNHALSR